MNMEHQQILVKTLREEDKCPNCGGSMKARWRQLSVGMVTSLEALVRKAVISGNSDVHLLKDLNLDPISYANFAGMKYWGLVEKSGEGRSGSWKVTEKGLEFLGGRIEVPAKVLVFRNKVKDRSREMVNITMIHTDRSMEYWQKEFPFTIRLSKIVPLEIRTESLF